MSHGLKVGREKALQVCGAEHSRQGAQLEQRSQDAMSLAVGQHRKEVRVAEVPALVGRLRGTQRNSLFNGGKCKAKTGVIREKTIILDPTPQGPCVLRAALRVPSSSGPCSQSLFYCSGFVCV